MRKRVLTYSLAVAMAVAMAVPQTVILSTGIVQVKAANTETGLKTGIAITKAEWGKNGSGTENYIKFTEMDKYASTSSDYCSKINKVVVNDKEYPVYDEEGKDNYYSMSYLNGFCVYMGSIKDGENTIIVSANGYKDKKIIVNVDKTTKTVTTTTTSTGYKHVVAKDTKTVTKTVVTTTKVYYKKTLTTTVKKQVTVTTTTINYLRSGNPDYMKLMGTVNTQIPTKVGNAMKADGLKVVLNPNLSYDGVYSASRNSIEMKNNVDYCFMHEIGHYVDRKTGYVSGSTEFKNIFNSEKSKYKGFYSDWNLDSGNYARTRTSDYFAECFRDYYFSANSRSKLKANCPKSYSFIQKTINKF